MYASPVKLPGREKRSDSGGREAGEFKEGPCARHDEEVGMTGKTCAIGLDERDHGQLLALGDVEGTHLLDGGIGG